MARLVRVEAVPTRAAHRAVVGLGETVALPVRAARPGPSTGARVQATRAMSRLRAMHRAGAHRVVEGVAAATALPVTAVRRAPPTGERAQAMRAMPAR